MRMGVQWGAAPDLAAPMSSLGQALGAAMSGGGGGGKAALTQSRLARDAAYIDSLATRNAYTQAQQQALEQKARLDAEKARIEHEEMQRVNQNRATGGTAFGDELVAGVPKPVPVEQHAPGLWRTAPSEYQPPVLSAVSPADQAGYTSETQRLRKMAPSIWDAGKSATDYMTTLQKARAMPMIENGSNEDYIRGNALNGKTVGEKDRMPVPVGVDGVGSSAPGKLTLSKNKDAYLENGPNGPEWKPIKGGAAPAGNTEAADSVNRALNAYIGLKDGGGIGPVVSSSVGRIGGRILGTGNEALREEYEAARAKLVMMERQRLMKGQGTVSDKDAAQIEAMFPKLDSVDPEVGIRTLQDMKKRLDAGAPHLYEPMPGGDGEDAAAGLVAGQTVMDGHRYMGGSPADPSNWEPI